MTIQEWDNELNKRLGVTDTANDSTDAYIEEPDADSSETYRLKGMDSPEVFHDIQPTGDRRNSRKKVYEQFDNLNQGLGLSAIDTVDYSAEDMSRDKTLGLQVAMDRKLGKLKGQPITPYEIYNAGDIAYKKAEEDKKLHPESAYDNYEPFATGDKGFYGRLLVKNDEFSNRMISQGYAIPGATDSKEYDMQVKLMEKAKRLGIGLWGKETSDPRIMQSIYDTSYAKRTDEYMRNREGFYKPLDTNWVDSMPETIPGLKSGIKSAGKAYDWGMENIANDDAKQLQASLRVGTSNLAGMTSTGMGNILEWGADAVTSVEAFNKNQKENSAYSAEMAKSSRVDSEGGKVDPYGRLSYDEKKAMNEDEEEVTGLETAQNVVDSQKQNRDKQFNEIDIANKTGKLKELYDAAKIAVDYGDETKDSAYRDAGSRGDGGKYIDKTVDKIMEGNYSDIEMPSIMEATELALESVPTMIALTTEGGVKAVTVASEFSDAIHGATEAYKKRNGVDKVEAKDMTNIVAMAAVYTYMDTLGSEKVLKGKRAQGVLDKLIGGADRTLLTRFARTSVEKVKAAGWEAATEGLQEVAMVNAEVGGDISKVKKDDARRVIGNSLAGGIAGGVTNAAVDAKKDIKETWRGRDSVGYDPNKDLGMHVTEEWMKTANKDSAGYKSAKETLDAADDEMNLRETADINLNLISKKSLMKDKVIAARDKLRESKYEGIGKAYDKTIGRAIDYMDKKYNKEQEKRSDEKAVRDNVKSKKERQKNDISEYKQVDHYNAFMEKMSERDTPNGDRAIDKITKIKDLASSIAKSDNEGESDIKKEAAKREIKETLNSTMSIFGDHYKDSIEYVTKKLKRQDLTEEERFEAETYRDMIEESANSVIMAQAIIDGTIKEKGTNKPISDKDIETISNREVAGSKVDVSDVIGSENLSEKRTDQILKIIDEKGNNASDAEKELKNRLFLQKEMYKYEKEQDVVAEKLYGSKQKLGIYDYKAIFKKYGKDTPIYTAAKVAYDRFRKSQIDKISAYKAARNEVIDVFKKAESGDKKAIEQRDEYIGGHEVFKHRGGYSILTSVLHGGKEVLVPIEEAKTNAKDVFEVNGKKYTVGAIGGQIKNMQKEQVLLDRAVATDEQAVSEPKPVEPKEKKDKPVTTIADKKGKAKEIADIEDTGSEDENAQKVKEVFKKIDKKEPATDVGAYIYETLEAVASIKSKMVKNKSKDLEVLKRDLDKLLKMDGRSKEYKEIMRQFAGIDNARQVKVKILSLIDDVVSELNKQADAVVEKADKTVKIADSVSKEIDEMAKINAELAEIEMYESEIENDVVFNKEVDYGTNVNTTDTNTEGKKDETGNDKDTKKRTDEKSDERKKIEKIRRIEQRFGERFDSIRKEFGDKISRLNIAIDVHKNSIDKIVNDESDEAIETIQRSVEAIARLENVLRRTNEEIYSLYADVNADKEEAIAALDKNVGNDVIEDETGKGFNSVEAKIAYNAIEKALEDANDKNVGEYTKEEIKAIKAIIDGKLNEEFKDC